MNFNLIKKLAKAIYRKLKNFDIVSRVLPSQKTINRWRIYYRKVVGLPILFYILHPNILHKGILFGPFAGTRLHTKTLWCNAPNFFLGTYEKEIQNILVDLSKFANNIQNIWIIGAAEGYYVCALGRMYKQTKIIAYESSIESQNLLAQNVALNKLSERVTILGKCSYNEFYFQVNQTKPDFILCDIEGYENILFSKEILSLLTNTILIIETHPPYSLFAKTSELEKNHKVLLIEPKERTLSDYPGFKWVPTSKKLEWISERRPFSTPWIVAFPKQLDFCEKSEYFQ